MLANTLFRAAFVRQQAGSYKSSGIRLDSDMNQSRTLEVVNPKPRHTLGSSRALMRASAIHAIVGPSLRAKAVFG